MAVPLDGGKIEKVSEPAPWSRGIVAWNGGALVARRGRLSLLDDAGRERRVLSVVDDGPFGSSAAFAYDPKGVVDLFAAPRSDEVALS